jgi:pyruvate dehydrogenase E1 component alpha subunit
LRGHYEGDPGKYREAIAKEEWQRVDPILRFVRRGVEQGWFDEDEAAQVERDAVEAIEEAVEFARSSDYPDSNLPAELVYAEQG